MKHIKIIGIGSPFGPDKLGWQVVDQLRHNLAEQNNGVHINFIQSDRPGLRLLDLIRNADTAILVDAIDQKDSPGQILELDRHQLLQNEHTLSSHSIGVSDALSLAATLGEIPEELVLFGLCVDRSKPEPACQQQVDLICNRIREYVVNYE